MKFVIYILVLFSFSNFFSPYKKYSKTEMVMGTVLTVTAFHNQDGEKLLNELFQLAQTYEQLFSSRREDGVIFSINKNSSGIIKNDEVSDLIQKSLDYAVLTEGAFDPGLYRIISLWDIEKSNNIPKVDDITSAMKESGYKNIIINGNHLQLLHNAGLDLGAIAKGRIIGLLADFLKEKGCNDFLINAGGDLVASGLYDKKREWNIAIADPYNKNETIGFIKLTGKSIVTSGDYERYFIGADGKRYHHIIDPATGFPVDNGLNSVTVISDSPTEADALSTAFFVMGIDKSLKLAEKLDGVEAIFIKKDEHGEIKIITTQGIIMKPQTENGFEFEVK